jgi:hypothetical protein
VGVFASVYVDGWAPPILELRLRNVAAFCPSIRIQCLYATPVNSALLLTVRTSWGVEFNLDVNQLGPFEIKVPFNQASKNQDVILYIESKQAILYDSANQGNADNRKLVYKVEHIQLDS